MQYWLYIVWYCIPDYHKCSTKISFPVVKRIFSKFMPITIASIRNVQTELFFIAEDDQLPICTLILLCKFYSMRLCLFLNLGALCILAPIFGFELIARLIDHLLLKLHQNIIWFAVIFEFDAILKFDEHF